MSRGDKKHKKHVERQKKLAERSRHAETLALGLRRRARYPEIVFDDTSGDPEFVELIKSVVASIDFDSPGFCNSTERILYKLIREKGWNYTLECLDEVEHNLEADGDKSARLHKVSFTIHFGHAIFSRIPDATLRKFLPFNDLMVIPRGQTLILQFSSMLSEKGSGGTVFYSRRRPQITLGGASWTVAFSRHAIEQLCNRLSPDHLRYDAAGDLHVFFNSCVYFEPTELNNGEPAFCLYNKCYDAVFASYDRYVKQILGEENVDPFGGLCYYRVGYCPVVFEGGFAKAKTFLFPGFKETPEFSLLRQADLSPEDRRRLMQDSRENDAIEVLFNDNVEVVKWFHDHGIRQVVQMSQPVFVDDKPKIR